MSALTEQLTKKFRPYHHQGRLAVLIYGRTA